MGPIAKISSLTYVFFGTCLGLIGVYQVAAEPSLFWLSITFGWLGLIQVANHHAEKGPRLLARLIHWIHAITFEIFAFIATMVLRLRKWFRRKSPEVRPEERQSRPILLVHGYLHDSSAWVYHHRQLRKKGHGPIYELDLSEPFLSIPEYAEKVKKKVDQIEEETGKRGVILIGHSMGGLVSTVYATTLASKGQVTDLITIGSPLAGTHMATLAIGRNGKDMRRNSPLVQQLQKAMAKEGFTRGYQIGTRTDQLIVPSSSAFVGHAPERQLFLEDIGHCSLLFSARVARKIDWWLKIHSGL